MAKTIGPLHSFEASGKVASMVFGNWRGISWVRSHFIPQNPKTALQINVRTAMALSVAEWQAQAQGEKDLWDAAAAGKPLSGYNLFMQDAMDAYVIQLTTAVTPVSVVYTPPYPGSFLWS